MTNKASDAGKSLKQPRRPGQQSTMNPQPKSISPHHTGSGKLAGKVALITGGDSGIGRAVAVAFAREGADIAVSYLSEHKDAEKTKLLVEKEGHQCLLIDSDIGEQKHCQSLVNQLVERFGGIDCLVNNAAEQSPVDSILDISPEQLERTFRTNVFSMFFLTQAALPHLADDGTIINTASVTAYKGNPGLLDYSSTKGAIIAFTRSLALSLAERGIRVNAVAPGPIWTPLITSTFTEEHIASFGQNTALKRPGQPDEVAPAYVYLASKDSTYVTGQTLHVNGGSIVNS